MAPSLQTASKAASKSANTTTPYLPLDIASDICSASGSRAWGAFLFFWYVYTFFPSKKSFSVTGLTASCSITLSKILPKVLGRDIDLYQLGK